MQSFLLGYDLRLSAESYVSARWDGRARDVFLLRRDLPWPLSVDCSVWPSVFRYTPEPSPHQIVTLDGILQAQPMTWLHPVLDLWPDRDAMIAAIDRNAAPELQAAPLVPIAVMLVGDDALRAAPDWQAIFSEQEPADSAPPDWRLLGYDVADASRTSSLSNCGYREDEVVSMRKTWAGRLNQHGLFDDPGQAADFRSISDHRIPEHSPFYVYALYRAPEDA